MAEKQRFNSDDEVMLKGIMLSDAARRFLARRRTQQVIDMGWMLDEDVVKDLVEASDEMYAARLARRDEAMSTGPVKEDS